MLRMGLNQGHDPSIGGFSTLGWHLFDAPAFSVFSYARLVFLLMPLCLVPSTSTSMLYLCFIIFGETKPVALQAFHYPVILRMGPKSRTRSFWSFLKCSFIVHAFSGTDPPLWKGVSHVTGVVRHRGRGFRAAQYPCGRRGQYCAGVGTSRGKKVRE